MLTTLDEMQGEVAHHIINNTEVRVVNVGIGAYEWWGQKCYDNRVGWESDGGSVAVSVPTMDMVESYGFGPWRVDMDKVEIEGGLLVDVFAEIVSVGEFWTTLEVTWGCNDT